MSKVFISFFCFPQYKKKNNPNQSQPIQNIKKPPPEAQRIEQQHEQAEQRARERAEEKQARQEAKRVKRAEEEDGGGSARVEKLLNRSFTAHARQLIEERRRRGVGGACDRTKGDIDLAFKKLR